MQGDDDPAVSTLAQRLATVAINICATVGVVAANKMLFLGSMPISAITLTWLHYCSGALFSRVAIGAGAFEYRHVPWREVFSVYALNMMAIVCQNWSLKVNGMDFYQLMKALTLPYSAVVDYYAKGRLLNSEAAWVVLAITAGAMLVAVQEVGNLTTTVGGLLVALLSVLVTPLPIAAFGPLMRKHDVSSLQLFSQGSVAGAVMLTPLVLLEVGWRSLASTDSATASTVLDAAGDEEDGRSLLSLIPLALVSCASAYCINFTVNAMARDYAGVTYYVINNFKTTLILAMGVYVFGNGELPTQKALGMVIAVIGQFLYPFRKAKVWPWSPGAVAALTGGATTASSASSSRGSNEGTRK